MSKEYYVTIAYAQLHADTLYYAYYDHTYQKRKLHGQISTTVIGSPLLWP